MAAFDYRPRGLALWDPWFVTCGGTVHLFYQQGRPDPGSDRDPADCDAVGHAVSSDLLHWEERPCVLRPDPAYPLEDLWAWTGCAVAAHERCYLFYTMRAGADGGSTERIGVALSDDYERWERYGGNPVLEPEGRWYRNRANATVPGRIDCRDLCVVRDDTAGCWYGFYAARTRHGEMPQTAVIGAARSTDLLAWEPLPPAFAPGTYGTVEVPEVFALDGRWYLTCLTGFTHGNRPPLSDPAVLMGTMYAVADRPEGPYHELPDDNVLYGGGPPCPHSCRSVLFQGERYVLSTQETGSTNTLSPPMVARALPDGRLRLAYSPRTEAWRQEALLGAGKTAPSLDLIPPLGHWCPLLSGTWEAGDGGYRGASVSGWQTADLGVGGECVEVAARVTLHRGVAAGVVLRPHGTLEHNVGDVVAGLDAAEQVAFVATLPAFMECHRRRLAVEHGRQYHLRAVLRPPRLELYVDDLLAVQCALAGRDWSAGSLGLFIDRGEATVRDLQAWRLG